ncbi:hypothetical protein FGADI_92 [Fusarium gaditjirri]|uniref:2EXR domain-containing protein n=1 Tax=Fusarium gaditjirri TaxID=282569 RepID=A0A8H4X5H4_9HYPO|nr:hypothetical protein FGADI_92 [Fusarium gaditjirri]
MSSSVAQRAQLRRPESFAGFAKLPPELRLMIWELALDRSGYTVHVYPLRDNTSSNNLDPKTSSRATLNFILKREYDMCVTPIENTRSEYDENEKDRGMWRACKESREIIMKKNTKGTFNSYFDNRLTARLTTILKADIIHLVRVPPHLDEAITQGIEPSPSLMKSVNEAIKSENVFMIDYKRPLTSRNARRALWSFVCGFAPLGQVFLIDNGLKRTQPIEPGTDVPDVIFEGNGMRFVKVSTTSIALEDEVLGQEDRDWMTTRHARNISLSGYHSRCYVVACEYL